MNFSKYTVIWPEVARLFPLHAQADRMPNEAEVQAKVDELYNSGNVLDGSRLTLWWGSIPESAIPRRPLNELHPQAGHDPDLSPQENRAFDRLAELPIVPEESYITEKIAGIRFRDFAVPLGVMILVVALMLSAVVINGLNRISPESDGTARLDRFPQGPVIIAPEATYPGQTLAAKDEAPVAKSAFFKSIHLYRVSDNLELSPNPTAEVASLWKRAVAIFGADAKRLDSFGIAYESSSQIAGYLDLDTRTLVVNLNGNMKDTAVQDFTLTHEYNHMVSLMDQYGSGSSCSTTLLLSGNICLDKDSILQSWIDQFWGEPGMLDNTTTGNIEAGKKMYDKRPGEFFSQYAASAPQEDMAESFAAWVLGYELPPKKDKFFDNDAESRALKARILSSLDEL